MKKSSLVMIIITLVGVLVLTSSVGFAQKVANYSFGKYGSAEYEHFSFWTKAGKRAEVTYAYGKDSKQMTAKYLGTATYQGKKCFKIELPGSYVLYITPTGTQLKIAGPAKKYEKLFAWEYKGPINGVGTFCNVCAQDEKEAMGVINGWFMK